MRIRTKSIALLFLLLLSTHSSAKQELLIGVGNFEPFFIEEGERGVFLDITKAIFERLPEYEINFVFMSNTRLLADINESSRIDVACNIIADSNNQAFLSDPIFRYTDVAVTKRDKALVIESVSDLAGKSIAAYQGATDLLGADYREMALTNEGYTEYSKPSETTRLVVTGAKDVRVGDVHIFLNDIKSDPFKRRGKLKKSDFVIHKLWPDVYTHLAFRDDKLRDKVNVAIREIKKNGVLEKIYSDYYEYLTLE